jgi:hypothetical protein
LPSQGYSVQILAMISPFHIEINILQILFCKSF